ncbi:MAG: GIY-YIG nuclease family protein [Patescibacteria group bacterium]|jgi:putative endonuclease|nr:GIY-YIG nuclease family protein [Patescibacteria group bacterium]
MFFRKKYYVYILASQRNGTLYVGVTSEIKKRVYQHKRGVVDSFTKRYKINRLVYYEEYNDINLALEREKQLKKWRRVWKIRLIEEFNSHWRDLYDDLL